MLKLLFIGLGVPITTSFKSPQSSNSLPFLSDATLHSSLKKSDFYSADDMSNILDLHNQLLPTLLPTPPPTPPWRPRAIACDVDGTLIVNSVPLPNCAAALIALTKLPTPPQIFLATGKTKAGALNSLGPPLSTYIEENNVPGVYCQGNVVIGRDNVVIDQSFLPQYVIDRVEKLINLENSIDNNKIEIVAYVGDGLVSHLPLGPNCVELSSHYLEPVVKLVRTPLATYSKINKLLVMSTNETYIDEVLRPQLESNGLGCTITKAISTMLEVLPVGGTKDRGVRTLLAHLDIPVDDLLAFGDAENDFAMLEMARMGVLVGKSSGKSVGGVLNEIYNNEDDSITFVTGNKKKLEEVTAILGGTVNLVSKKLDLPELQGEPIFVAREKCKLAVAEIPGGRVIIEDTSLCFNALNGLPGPYIKWFSDSCGHEGLNKMLDGFMDRTAYAQTIVAYCDGDEDNIEIFVGRTNGEIVEARAREGENENAFGWDPIFQCSEGESAGKTYAEMTVEEKNKVSHRSRAFRKLLRMF